MYVSELYRRLLLPLVLVGLVLSGLSASTAIAQSVKSPSDTVREFYKAMRAKKFREAFAISIYKPAIEPLSSAEFDDLRPDFERLAATYPEKLDISGEQVSGDVATVFIKSNDPDTPDKSEPMSLIRVKGMWIVGDKESQEIVEKAGKDFFFTARINAHHNDVQDLLKRIALAELVYNQQHNGKFGDLAALIAGGLIPKDLEGTESTGYRFRVNVSADAKAWIATAEPSQYGRTGRLSFYMDQNGVKSGDVGGKPLDPNIQK
jgi:hypothetical protein